MMNNITSHFLGTYQEKPQMPYDFHKDKTLLEEFYKQIKEMDSKTIMNASLDPERLRQWREERKKNILNMSYQDMLLR